jgi:hypothetical protein
MNAQRIAEEILNSLCSDEIQNIKVLFHAGFGEYQVSELAVEIIRVVYDQVACHPENFPGVMGKIEDVYELIYGITTESRHNRIVTHVFDRLKDAFGKNIRCKTLDYVYKNYIKIKDYDGAESVHVEYAKYTLDEIKKIIASQYTNEEKYLKIACCMLNNR